MSNILTLESYFGEKNHKKVLQACDLYSISDLYFLIPATYRVILYKYKVDNTLYGFS
jgi:hypothetical protein